jgi:homoserine kinase
MRIEPGKKICIYSPASVANVGCGFDIFAFALSAPGDEIHLTLKKERGVKISKITGIPSLPTDPQKNTAGVSMLSMLEDIGADFGVVLEIHKKMPFKSGLGSSAASAVGSVFALNRITGLNLSNETLLKYAMAGEKIASFNQVHLDNISACLYGGFILARSQNPVEILKIPVPENLHYIILHPHIDIDTSEARQILPQLIKLSSAVEQWANTAAVMTALFKEDYDLLRRAITDNIIEPIRAREIPFFQELKETALATGAVGFGVSGSGPSVFALAKSAEEAESIRQALSRCYLTKDLPFDTYLDRINTEGPRVLSAK